MLIDQIDKNTANVYGIYGHLGGGKSLTAVELSVEFLRLGWTVTSNIQLYHIEKFPGKFQYIEDFATVDPWTLPCGASRGSADKFRSVIVIDEVAEFFDQYSSSSPLLKQFLSWLRHSSKRGQFVFLIVQQPEFIAKGLRLLVNKWIVCQDMQQSRLPILRIRPPFLGDFVARRIFDKYGNLISTGLSLAEKHNIGYYYNTAQSIALQGRGSDHVDNSSNNIPYSGLIQLVIILYILFLLIWI